jgi:hypothetical protein
MPLTPSLPTLQCHTAPATEMLFLLCCCSVTISLPSPFLFQSRHQFTTSLGGFLPMIMYHYWTTGVRRSTALTDSRTPRDAPSRQSLITHSFSTSSLQHSYLHDRLPAPLWLPPLSLQPPQLPPPLALLPPQHQRHVQTLNKHLNSPAQRLETSTHSPKPS